MDSHDSHRERKNGEYDYDYDAYDVVMDDGVEQRIVPADEMSDDERTRADK